METIEIGNIVNIRLDVLAKENSMCNCEDDSGTWCGTSGD